MDHSFKEFTSAELKKVAESVANTNNSNQEKIKYKYIGHTLIIEDDNGCSYAKLRVCLNRTRKHEDWESKKIVTTKDQIYTDAYL